MGYVHRRSHKLWRPASASALTTGECVTGRQMNGDRRRVGIVVSGAVLVALSGPGQTAGFSVFVDPLISALDVSRGGLTVAYLIGTLAASTTGTWLGRVADRRPMSQVIRGVAGALGLATVVAAASVNIVMLTVAVYGLRSFGQTGMTLSASVFVARSVDRRRGAALGLLTAVGGSAIALTPLLASRLISAAGWRWAWLILAVTVVVIGNLTAVVVGRLDRDGVPSAAVAVADHQERTVAADTSWAMRRNGFVLVATAFTCNGVVATALAFHQIAILGERGLDSAAAAANFLPQSLAAALVALAIGRVVDRLIGRWVLVTSMAMLTLATLSVTRVDGGFAAVSFGVLLGSATAATASTEGALLARWVGVDRLGTLRGRMMTVVVIGTALAPLGFEMLAVVTGSFTAAARLLSILPVGVAVMASVIPLPTEVVGEPAKMA